MRAGDAQRLQRLWLWQWRLPLQGGEQKVMLLNRAQTEASMLTQKSSVSRRRFHWLPIACRSVKASCINDLKWERHNRLRMLLRNHGGNPKIYQKYKCIQLRTLIHFGSGFSKSTVRLLFSGIWNQMWHLTPFILQPIFVGFQQANREKSGSATRRVCVILHGWSFASQGESPGPFSDGWRRVGSFSTQVSRAIWWEESLPIPSWSFSSSEHLGNLCSMKISCYSDKRTPLLLEKGKWELPPLVLPHWHMIWMITPTLWLEV